MGLRRLAFALLPGFFLCSATWSSDNGTRAALARCAAIVGDSARLSCYDELANATADVPAVTAMETRPPAAPKSPPGEAVAVPLDDSVGKGGVDDDAPPPTFAARLVRCEEAGPSNRTLFYLDNGQVWRQSNARRLRLRDCGGDIEITEDLFGFKIRIPGEKRAIRVARIR